MTKGDDVLTQATIDNLDVSSDVVPACSKNGATTLSYYKASSKFEGDPTISSIVVKYARNTPTTSPDASTTSGALPASVGAGVTLVSGLALAWL